MQTEQKSERAQTPAGVPEHLRGTRQGIFHLLSQSARGQGARALPGQNPAQPRLPPAPGSEARKPEPVDPWQVVLQTDNFIFSD